VEHDAVVTFIRRVGGVDTILGVLPLEGAFGGLDDGEGPTSPGEHFFGRTCGGDGVWATIQLVAGVPVLSVTAPPPPVLRCDKGMLEANLIYEKCVPFSPATQTAVQMAFLGSLPLRSCSFIGGSCANPGTSVVRGCGFTQFSWSNNVYGAIMFVNNHTLECEYEIGGPRFNNDGFPYSSQSLLKGSGVVTVDANGYIRGSFTATTTPYGCPNGEGSGGGFDWSHNGPRSLTFTL
jgi:hypothetical protein